MFEFELPDLGEGVAEGEVLAWHVAVGDEVAEDQVLAEVETDKAAVDVPSPVDGVVHELHAEVGDIVATGEVLVTVEEGAEAASESAGEAAETTDDDGDSAEDRVFAPPSVRRLAREEGVDITAVEGTGPRGRITEADVEAAAPELAGSEPKSVVSKVDDDEQEQPTSVVSKVDDEGDEQPTSVVSKVDDDEDGPTRVISPVEDDGDTETTVVDLRDDGPAVKSAVRRASADPMAERRDHTLATPATRRLARELGVDIDAVPTDESRDGEPYVDAAAVRAVASEARSGSDTTASEREEATDEITDEDVREVSERVVSELRETADAARRETADELGAGPTTVEASDEDRREPYRGVRRTIGEQMARSRREVPHATHHDKVAVPGLVEARERLQPLAEERGVHLTYTPLVLKCVAAALDEHPILATQLDTEAEEIVYRSDRHLGMATATDHGLVVPVVEDVDEKGLLELAADVNGLVSRARSRDIAREEMQGGVFTVTNFGAIGGEYADPVINVPETAILGVGALKERPVVEGRDQQERPSEQARSAERRSADRSSGQSPREDGETASGEIVAKPTLTLSLAIDHRVVDGADAARFMNTLKSYLADPTRLLA